MALWLLQLSLLLMTAILAHLLTSFGQTVLHRKLAHHAKGGLLFRNHVAFHHSYYSKDHLVSKLYFGREGNNTPYFLIPVVLIGVLAFFLLPLAFFLVLMTACSLSFYAHVFLDKEYHVEKSPLQRFGWFRRKQALHFVHHRHANTNFAVIDFFWDRLLGTYRAPE